MPVTHVPWPEEVLDREDIYDERIAPLMSQIIATCKEHHIPMFATFLYAPEQFCTTSIPGPKSSDAAKKLRQCERIVYEEPYAFGMTITTQPTK